MKDYIYLDKDFLNSSLAQYEKGLVNNFSHGKTLDKSTNDDNSKVLSKGIDNIFGVGAKLVHDTVKTNGQELTKGQSETIDYVLNDYATDLLLEKINDDSVLKETASDAEEGEYISCSSIFKIYDFDLISKISAPENLELFKSELSDEDKNKVKEYRNQLNIVRSKGTKLTKNQRNEIKELEKQIEMAENNDGNWSNLDIVNKGANFANQIFSGSLLIKSDSAISICKRDCFRLDQAQLSFLTESSRPLRIFGVVTAVKEKTHANGEFNELGNDDLYKFPNMFHDIFLSNFNMLHDGDRIIKPIAIFFE